LSNRCSTCTTLFSMTKRSSPSTSSSWMSPKISSWRVFSMGPIHWRICELAHHGESIHKHGGGLPL
jgi:hypothetical protein